MTRHAEYQKHARVTGPIVMVGFGSIGKGAWPLIQRHLEFDPHRVTVVDPNPQNRSLLESQGIRIVLQTVTQENYVELLSPLLTEGTGQGFCVNLAVELSCVDLMKLCRSLDVLYIDTCTEPWPGFYFNDALNNGDRTVYALRETVRDERRRAPPGATTAVSCCGANPGMVSWLVKQALVDIAQDIGLQFHQPKSNDCEGWAKLMQRVGIKGIHIAERDTQRSKQPKPLHAFWNTWSIAGFVCEVLQPAELAVGTHEKWLPSNARQLVKGSQQAIYLEQAGVNTRVRSWCPTPGPQHCFLMPHNESWSIADFFTCHDVSGQITYRPTCHFAYHPCNDAVLSLMELRGSEATSPNDFRVLEEEDLLDGMDELGVLLYGHEKNAYWYGSQLTLSETRRVAPFQNATGLQVSSAVLAGMVWALEHPNAGIVETDEMDYVRCLEVQSPYLGRVQGYYTEWTPLSNRHGLFEEDLDKSDAWQFRNVLVR